MYKCDFNFEDIENEMESFEGSIFKKTKEHLEKQKEEIFGEVCSDIENWMNERFENVQRRYFHEIIDFMLGRGMYAKYRPRLEKFLSGLGYNEESFRKKIYEENKEIINESIFSDACFEKLYQNFCERHFRYFYFKDIHKNLDQHRLIKEIIEYLVKGDKGAFKEHLNNVLDNEIESKKNTIDELEKEIEEKHSLLNSDD